MPALFFAPDFAQKHYASAFGCRAPNEYQWAEKNVHFCSPPVCHICCDNLCRNAIKLGDFLVILSRNTVCRRNAIKLGDFLVCDFWVIFRACDFLSAIFSCDFLTCDFSCDFFLRFFNVRFSCDFWSGFLVIFLRFFTCDFLDKLVIF